MTTARMGTGSGNGIALIVSAGVVYEIIAACCSSPQTTEINAATRSETLMKWVWLGVAQSAGFIALAAVIDPSHRKAIVVGGGIAMVILFLQYQHAKASGLANGGPPTETYS